MNYWELFDLEKDPEEMTSVYDDSTYAKVRNTMHAELDRLQKNWAIPSRKCRSRCCGSELFSKATRFKPVPLEAVLERKEAAGQVPAIDPSRKPFTVGATCTPTAPDGVFLADGGAVRRIQPLSQGRQAPLCRSLRQPTLIKWWRPRI